MWNRTRRKLMIREDTLASWESRIKELDERLRPIANRPVDISEPNWLDRLQRATPPLDEAGVRTSAQALLEEIISAYAQSTESMRAATRELFRKYHAFSWAATSPERPTTVKTLEQHLMLFSIKDQGRDSRDALVTLGEICQEATAAGVDLRPALEQAAALSSPSNPFGMGSTQQMLLRAIS
jgi:hypothetical protein